VVLIPLFFCYRKFIKITSLEVSAVLSVPGDVFIGLCCEMAFLCDQYITRLYFVVRVDAYQVKEGADMDLRVDAPD